jgi:hypothetical protein
MYLRCLVLLLFSSLLMAQPQQQSAPSNSESKDSATSSQNNNSSPKAASDDKSKAAAEEKEEGQGKPSGRVDDDDDVPNASKVMADKSKLPADAPVITIEGVCDQQSAGGAEAKDAASSNCKTVITREQFEKLADSLNPNMPPAVRRQLATAYPRLLLFSKKAKEMGLDKEPRYQEMMKWASLQVLANNLTQQMQKKAGDISDADVEKYYKDNPDKFQQFELQRIFIPKNKQHPMSASNAPAKENPADEAAMKAEAKKIQARAAAGGDFTALQKEAFDVAGLKAASPNVSLGKLTKGSLPQDHQKVFELKPKQVSELFSDPGGFYVYKVLSENMIPLSEAKNQIHSTLQSERMQASMESLMGTIKPELNPAYFGGAAPPTRPLPPGMKAPPTKPQASTQDQSKKQAAQEAPANAPK